MGTVNVTLGDGKKLNLVLGQQLENAVTAVVFDFSAWQTEFGSGTLGLSVQRHGDTQPYAVVPTVSGTNATWNISELDTAYKGVGEVQVTYTVGTKVKKSVVYKFTVYRSLGENGEYPSPGQTWQEEIEDELADVKQDLLALEQEGYPYASIEEAVNAWADDHNVSIVNPFVIPQMYGAKGNGVNDDYNAFVDAINSMSDGDVLYVPNGEYLLSATLSITKNILIYCDGELSVSHSNPAIVLDGLSNALVKINTIKKPSRVFDYVEGSVNYSIGVVLKNCDTCIVDINNILNTTTGIVLLGEVDGCHYNEISCNNAHTFTGIEIIRSSQGGWVNGNVINKFRWMVNTWGDNSNLVPSYMVKSLSYAASGESEPYKNNANMFHNLSAEYGAASANYPISLVRLNYARGYTFDFNRVEILAKTSSLYDNFFYFTNSTYCIATIWFSINSFNTNIGTTNHNFVYEKGDYESLKYSGFKNILSDIEFNSSVSYTQYWFDAVMFPSIKTVKIQGELIVNQTIPALGTLISNLPVGRAGYGILKLQMGTTATLWNPPTNVTFYKVSVGGRNGKTLSTVGEIPSGTRLYIDIEYLVDDSAL